MAHPYLKICIFESCLFEMGIHYAFFAKNMILHLLSLLFFPLYFSYCSLSLNLDQTSGLLFYQFLLHMKFRLKNWNFFQMEPWMSGNISYLGRHRTLRPRRHPATPVIQQATQRASHTGLRTGPTGRYSHRTLRPMKCSM